MKTISTSVAARSGPFPLAGSYAPAFEHVFNVFRNNFKKDLELGASVCVLYRGQPVVDLWGGYRDAIGGSPWEEDTICCTMSIAKGVTALCIHLLVERGVLKLDMPVAEYWPEFAANGKENILLEWVLDHRAGLPVVTDPLWPGAVFDWTAMTTALARQAPVLKPGEEMAYHTRTFGFILGEVIRRVAKQTVGEFLASNLAKGIDFRIGLKDADIARCATIELEESKATTTLAPPTELVRLTNVQMPQPNDLNAEAYRRSEIPSSNGHGNARAIAVLYSTLIDGTLRGEKLLSRNVLCEATKERHQLRDVMLNRACRQASGFLLNTPATFAIGPNASAVGVNGAGGALAFADPLTGLAFGYAPNRLHAPGLIGPSRRALDLVDAMYRSISQGFS
ncbi:serine hydrolase domain-containing protein (plasmid) [Mesorhizobium sp. ORM8.1]